MQNNNCPQCQQKVEGVSQRIIKDSCGHEKCRLCLLNESEGCKQCQNINDINQKIDSQTSVITCLINHEHKQNVDTKEENYIENLNVRRKEADNNIKLKLNPKSTNKRSYKFITLPSHIVFEPNSSLYLCQLCQSKFKTRSHIRYHEFCDKGEKPFSCKNCAKSFILKSQLELHMLKHSGLKPHICKICDKSFLEASKLKRHVNLHANNKSFACPQCNKTFKSKESLKLHLVVHSGDKPYTCDICKKKFNNSSNLKKHIVIHSDNKNHMCDQCGKTFKLKWTLTLHRRSHSFSHNFSCKRCDKSFAKSTDLKRHELVHLEKKLFTCGLCSVSFRRKDNLKRHIRNTHPGKKAEVIKNVVNSKPLLDHPNAINVITASPKVHKEEKVLDLAHKKSNVINGPLKLAFKTSAFKRIYNINRTCEFNFPENDNNPLPILPSNTTWDYDRPHIIKNLKYKIPDNYKYNSNTSDFKEPTVSSEIANHSERGAVNILSDSGSDKNYNEAMNISRTSSTSVIVNTSDQQASMHWRRRISQNVLNIKENL